MSPPSALSFSSSVPLSEASARAPASVNTDVPICLDFLKGRCARSQCRFLHPDLTRYQQLSGAVQSQAGRHVCEVWAMTGTCKFGAKCSRLHPSVVLNQPVQPAITLLLPMAVMAHPLMPVAPAESPVPSQRRDQAAALLPPPVPHPTGLSAVTLSPVNPQVTISHPGQFFPLAPHPAAPAIAFRAPQPHGPRITPTTSPVPVAHGPPPSSPMASFVPFAAAPVAPGRPHHTSPPLEDAPQAELQELARSILVALESTRRDSRTVLPISKKQSDVTPMPERGLSLACLFGTDHEAERPAIDLLLLPAVVPTPSAPKPLHKRSTNPKHDRDRAFLDMLRDLHNGH